MRYKIAPLQLTDRPRWAQLWTEYQTFYGVELPAAVTESTWQRMHNGRVRGLGARDSTDHLVGIVHFLFHEDTWSTAPACYLQDLYVDAKARGTGCARQLIEAVAESAKAAGANDPYWLTHETNATARLLYDRIGKNQGFIQYLYSR
ncbi:MAG: GNAT family N-acetyltransferase [Steroidobacteraceae bacterium]